MRHRIVSSRQLVKAHPTHIYKFLENLDNHKTLWPGVSGWEGDKDKARFKWSLGLMSWNVETAVIERVPGIRVCEERVSGGPFPYKRWFKIQADDQTAILEITMEAQMSGLQVLFLKPLIKAQFEQILRNIRATMEKPKTAAAPAATPSTVPTATTAGMTAAAPAASPAVAPATPPAAAPPNAASS